MLNEREEALNDLKEQLVRLKDNNKNQIQLITLIADDHSQYAEDVVKLVINHIKEAPSELKLYGLYAMDSIIKFPTGTLKEKYCRLFGNEIVELFVDTFKKAPIAHRQNLCKVRGTWKPLFLKSKLFALDNEVRKIDKSWPVFKDGESSSSKSSATKPTTISSPALVPTSAKPAPENDISSKLAPEIVTEQQKNASEAKVEQPKKILVIVDPKASEIKNEQKEIPNQLPKEITKERVEGKEMPKNTVSNFGVKQNENIMRKPMRKHPPNQDQRQYCIPEKKLRIDESHAFQPTAALGAHAFLTPSLTSMQSVAPFPMPPPPSLSPSGATPQVIKMEAEDSWRSAARQPLQPFNQSLSFGPPSFITNETPRFTNASNNRIFVGGRAYEVLYIENEAVIERNGLPHRIHFYGPPRDILIDGKPLKLAFNEMKTIYIDGVPHTIKFGAPSRELYIGGHPFRGAFGGPPMIANINGRRHEFRLCGPPPEVRIEQDPCYELSRHLYAIHGGPQNNSQPKKEEKLEKQDVISLLQKIKKHGILNNKPLTTSKNVSKPCDAATVTRQPLPPPQAGSTNIEVVIRQISPPETIKEFQIGVLMVRYSAVIEALHKPRTACPHCGIGFTDIKSEAYQRHIDGHVQDLLRTKESKKSAVRTWNMGIDKWLEYDEIAEVQKPPSTTSIGPDGSPLINGLPASPSDAIATTSLNKICTVCHEKFNEYYDDNEEEWKLQDSVIIDNSAIHRSCVEQLESSRNGNNENLCNKFK